MTTNKAKLETPSLPKFPARAARTVALVPLLPIAVFLMLGSWNAPQTVYGTISLLVLTALCLCGPEILAFPINARAELEHELALARCAGTSWFADIRAQGRCTLLTLGGLCLRAAHQRDQWVFVFAAAAVLYAGMAAGIVAGAAIGRLEASSAMWSGATSALASSYLFYLAGRYQRFGAVGPDQTRLLEVAELHQLCDQERRAELIGLIKKA